MGGKGLNNIVLTVGSIGYLNKKTEFHSFNFKVDDIKSNLISIRYQKYNE